MNTVLVLTVLNYNTAQNISDSFLKLRINHYVDSILVFFPERNYLALISLIPLVT